MALFEYCRDVHEQFLYENAVVYCGFNKLHLAFHFRLLHSSWGAQHFKNIIVNWGASLNVAGGWPTWVVSNHDFIRHASRWKGKNTQETTL